jgi:hypothetical protein
LLAALFLGQQPDLYGQRIWVDVSVFRSRAMRKSSGSPLLRRFNKRTQPGAFSFAIGSVSGRNLNL